MVPRYVWAIYLFPFIMFSLLVKKWKLGNYLLYILIGLQIILLSVFYIHQPFYKRFPIREEIKCVLEYASIKKVRFGISNYWYAKYLTLASQNQLKVYQITEKLEAYHWVNNSAPFQNVTYNLIILNDLPEAEIINKWETPDERHLCGKIQLLYYKNAINLF